MPSFAIMACIGGWHSETDGRFNGDVPLLLLLLRITHCKKRERRKKHCAAIRGEIYEAISYNG